METMTYEADGRVARITLDRPERGNGLTPTLIDELGGGRRARRPRSRRARDRAGRQRQGLLRRLRPRRQRRGPGRGRPATASPPPGSPLDPAVMAANHDPRGTWDPMVDYAMMCAQRPRVHVAVPLRRSRWSARSTASASPAAPTSRCAATCSSSPTNAKIGYPPARVWGSPTTSLWATRLGPQRAKRLLFTGDCLSGAEALEWGLAIEAPPADAARRAHRERSSQRIARMPLNQLQMMKLLVNQQTARPGPARDAAPRHRLRRHHPPHGRGLRVPAPAATEAASGRPSASATSPSATRAGRRPG